MRQPWQPQQLRVVVLGGLKDGHLVPKKDKKGMFYYVLLVMND